MLKSWDWAAGLTNSSTPDRPDAGRGCRQGKQCASLYKQVQFLFETIEPGEVFAWSSLIAPHQLTATARCSIPTRVVALPADALEDIFARAPQAGGLFMKRLAEVIARRLRHRTDKLIESWYQAFGEERL